MTRTAAAAVAAVALVLAAGAPAEARPRSRTAREDYRDAAIGTPEVFGFCYTVYRGDDPAENHGCVRFQVGARERSVDLRVTDASGLPVAAMATQDLDRDGVYETDVRFCGGVEGAKVRDGELIVWLPPVTAEGPVCLGTATHGTVAATFRSPR
jgi:hypothetical protein